MKCFKSLWLGLALIGMIAATGCGDSGTTQNAAPPQQNLQVGIVVDDPVGNKMVAGREIPRGSVNHTATSNIQMEDNRWEVSLYFAAQDKSCLMETRQEVELDGDDDDDDYDIEDLAEAVIEALIAGPQGNDEVCGIMPRGTKLQEVEMEEDWVLAVSLNEAFLQAEEEGNNEMLLTLYGLVDSLACIEGIDAVQILIDGEEVEAYGGMICPGVPIVPWQNVVTK